MDSSALVKRYAREAGTGWVLGLFRRAAGHIFFAARIARVETAAAIVRKRRGGHITADAAARALRRMRRDFDTRIYVVEITPVLLQTGEAMAEKHYLRGYDAVQLAAALEANAGRAGAGLPPLVFVSADGDLRAAAAAEGLATENPESH